MITQFDALYGTIVLRAEAPHRLRPCRPTSVITRIDVITARFRTLRKHRIGCDPAALRDCRTDVFGLLCIGILDGFWKHRTYRHLRNGCLETTTTLRESNEPRLAQPKRKNRWTSTPAKVSISSAIVLGVGYILAGNKVQKTNVAVV